MTTLHLRNCTAQHRQFRYRLDFRDNPAFVSRAERVNFRVVDLKPFSDGVIEAERVMIPEVIEQMRQYNCLDVENIPNQLQGFVPVIFRDGARVDPRTAQDVIDHNRGVKWREGELRRRNAAIAANSAVVQHLNDTGQSADVLPQGFSVEMEQDAGTETEGGRRVEEGYEVKADGAGPGAGGRGRKAA